MRLKDGFSRLILAWFLVALGGAADVMGVTTVQVRDTGDTLQTSFTVPAGDDFTVSVNGSSLRVNVYAANSSEDIGRMTIQTSGGNPANLHVILGQAAWSGGTNEPSQTACRNWDGLSTALSDVGVWGRIAGDLTGSVVVDRLWYIIVDGDVAADLIASTNEGEPRLEAGAITSIASVELPQDNLFLLQVTGDVAGDVLVSGGDISALIVDGEISGSIECTHDDIVDLLLGGDISGSILAPQGMLGVPNDNFESEGSISGEIVCRRLGNVRIAGSLSGSVTITDGLVREGNSKADFFRIGDTFESTGRIFLPEGGLEGWISINWLDDGGEWEEGAEIVFGDPKDPTHVLTAPDYPDLPSALGGGTAGLARFQLHREACSPPANVMVDDVAPQTVRVRHYGFIYWTDMSRAISTTGTVPCLISKRCETTTQESWTDCTSDFSQRLVPFLGAGSTVAWAVEVETTPIGDVEFEEGYEYRVEVDPDPADEDDRLLCDGVGEVVNSGPPLDGYSPEYTFIVRTPCASDLNNDDAVDTADLGIFLAVFGAEGPCVFGDLNGDGVVDTADLGLLLGNYGADCSGGESLGGGGDSPIEAFGFESVEDYVDWLDSLTEKELFAHFVELLEYLGG